MTFEDTACKCVGAIAPQVTSTAQIESAYQNTELTFFTISPQIIVNTKLLSLKKLFGLSNEGPKDTGLSQWEYPMLTKHRVRPQHSRSLPCPKKRWRHCPYRQRGQV